MPNQPARVQRRRIRCGKKCHGHRKHAGACGGASGKCMGNETAQLWRPWGAREAGRERTMNMPCMVVTPEVSQLEILALKLCML